MFKIDFAGVTFGSEERQAVNKVLDGTWLASGKENELFETEFAKYIGVKHALAVNSGSSANLLALASLNLPKGSKVLTSGCGFPATLAPILHLGLEPVLVDYNLTTHNIDLNQIEAHSKDVKAILLAHTLGNPVDMPRLLKLGIPIIEDCCEAVGSKLDDKYVGSFGKLGTYSFYPSHQMTALGTGGMVVTDDDDLILRLRSLRDWGKVHDWNSYLGDHKTRYTHDGYFKQYTYETLGFNMKLSEAAAAFGRVQLTKLDEFRKRRCFNYSILAQSLQDLKQIIPVRGLKTADPSWFGFPLTLTEGNRNEFSDYLEDRGIRTRPFFAGNITRHKPFKQYEQDFPVADKLMKDSLFVGVWQGITEEQIQYMSDTIHDYVKERL
jgi:CDP-6-deoxy-D-xylo-4-hexulose-3-dehydrase